MRVIICFFLAVPFAYLQTHGQSTVVSGEYFFDTDPGVGAATPLPPFTANQSVDVSFLTSSSGLSAGMHMLGIRVLDSNNLWSIPAFTPMYVLASDPATIENISAAEYFFDTDPGAGNATAIPTGPAAPTIDLTFAAASSGLSIGMHILAVRTQNILGEWGIPTYTPVYVDQNRMITKLEYFFDTDPGLDNATQIAISPVTNVLDQFFDLNSSGLTPATHTLNVRAADQNGLWGMTTEISFVVCSGATPSVAPDIVCVGSATTFTDNSTTLAGDIYSWDYESDGVEDANTPGNKTFTYAAAGTYTATLTIDRGGCVSSTSFQVSVDAVPTVNAGSDQSVCGNTIINLTGAAGGPATVYTWSTSGDGNFSNANALNASYSPGPVDVAAGNALLTLTSNPVGACLSQTDQVTIALTRNPVLAVQTASAAIASAVSVSVTQGGTFNAGDVLTSSILAAPKKGTAQMQANNMLHYTASNGTVGKDSVQFQVCNQCSQCASGFVYFNIENVAPVINVSPANASAGQTLVIPINQSVADANGNIDFSTVLIIEPPVSGATASIDANYNLNVDYGAVDFSGTDYLTIQVCDDLNACAQNVITIQVQSANAEVVIYNAVAPNSPGDNRFMRILNLPPGNKVTIYNRWGDKVFEVEDYDNNKDGKRFAGNNDGGKALPSGMYFYKIQIPDGSKPGAPLITGYLSLRQ